MRYSEEPPHDFCLSTYISMVELTWFNIVSCGVTAQMLAFRVQDWKVNEHEIFESIQKLYNIFVVVFNRMLKLLNDIVDTEVARVNDQQKLPYFFNRIFNYVVVNF